MKTYYHRALLQLALSTDSVEFRRIAGYLARLRPGTVVPEPRQLADRLGLDHDTVVLMLDTIVNTGAVIREPAMAEAA